MRELEIARRLSELGQPEGACKAYKLALELNDGADPDIDMEAAAYILQFGSGEDYKISYTVFRGLYNRGIMKNSIIGIMRSAFYEPNIKLLKSHYDKNCKLLAKYPYIFRKDFPEFEKLPIQFFPYDDNSYTPFFPEEERFGEYINPKDQVISRNFFKDLEKPVLAEDVYSQYELEYLCDNVRKSEYIGRENHIYLHYSDWETFCSYLQCLNMKPLLEEKKLVFLMEDEISQYPIDFKERFGVDYSRYPLKPVGIREIHRMIWHTQLSSHNGGDFFNEVFDDHPNLLCMPSLMFDNVEETVKNILEAAAKSGSAKEMNTAFADWNNAAVTGELYRLRDRTPKDALVALYLREQAKTSPSLDMASRISPALFFQPHFNNIVYELHIDDKDRAVLHSAQYETLRQSPIFRSFKYIKTFTPIRRITTSHGATVKFMYQQSQQDKAEDESRSLVDDAVMTRALNRSFMIDWQDRLFKDSILVRFEDGKLNPRATFTALAAFLDIPYTESMTYCSEYGQRDPESYAGNARGFDPVTVYRTYDEYINMAERAYLEYFLRDAYEYYGYVPHYLEGIDPESRSAEDWASGFDTIDKYMRETWEIVFRDMAKSGVKHIEDLKEDEEAKKEAEDQASEQLLDQYMDTVNKNRLEVTKILMGGLRFINKNGQPLRMMPRLELDPALLEQPLYH